MYKRFDIKSVEIFHSHQLFVKSPRIRLNLTGIVSSLSRIISKRKMLRNLFVVLSIIVVCNADDCKPSITTASGSSAPQQICSGQLIFDENFDSLNKEIWRPLSTFSDGGVSYWLNLKIITSNRFVEHNFCYYFQKNKEFQWYSGRWWK